MAFKVPSFNLPYGAGVGVPLSSILGDTEVFDLLLQAPSANTGIVYVGDSTAQYFEMVAGSAVSLGDIFGGKRNEELIKLSQVYVKIATSGDRAVGLFPEQIL